MTWLNCDTPTTRELCEQLCFALYLVYLYYVSLIKVTKYAFREDTVSLKLFWSPFSRGGRNIFLMSSNADCASWISGGWSCFPVGWWFGACTRAAAPTCSAEPCSLPPCNLIEALPPSSLYPVACSFAIGLVGPAVNNDMSAIDTSAIDASRSPSAGWFWSSSCSGSDGGVARVGLKWAWMEDMAELIALMSLGCFFLGLTEEVDWVLLPGGHYICMCILLTCEKMDYSLWNSHFLCLAVTLCSLTRIWDSSSSQTCVWALSEIFSITLWDHFTISGNFSLIKLSSACTSSNSKFHWRRSILIGTIHLSAPRKML